MVGKRDVMENGAGKMRRLRIAWCTVVASEYGRRGHMPKNVGGPLEVRNRPKLTATKETGTLFLQS